jgi:hypothetical protein
MPKPDHLRTHKVCGARTRRRGCCQQPSMPNGRCRLHGGKSTGPRTAEGRERCRLARWKHGNKSAAVLEAKKARNEFFKASRGLLAGSQLELGDDSAVRAAHTALKRLQLLEYRAEVVRMRVLAAEKIGRGDGDNLP